MIVDLIDVLQNVNDLPVDVQLLMIVTNLLTVMEMVSRIMCVKLPSMQIDGWSFLQKDVQQAGELTSEQQLNAQRLLVSYVFND